MHVHAFYLLLNLTWAVIAPNIIIYFCVSIKHHKLEYTPMHGVECQYYHGLV